MGRAPADDVYVSHLDWGRRPCRNDRGDRHPPTGYAGGACRPGPGVAALLIQLTTAGPCPAIGRVRPQPVPRDSAHRDPGSAVPRAGRQRTGRGANGRSWINTAGPPEGSERALPLRRCRPRANPGWHSQGSRARQSRNGCIPSTIPQRMVISPCAGRSEDAWAPRSTSWTAFSTCGSLIVLLLRDPEFGINLGLCISQSGCTRFWAAGGGMLFAVNSLPAHRQPHARRG